MCIFDMYIKIYIYIYIYIYKYIYIYIYISAFYMSRLMSAGNTSLVIIEKTDCVDESP